MTPVEWKRIKEVAGDAWGRPVSEREAYVREACGGDETLRTEVMHLLQCMTQADAWLSAIGSQPSAIGSQLAAIGSAQPSAIGSEPSALPDRRELKAESQGQKAES